MKVLPEAVARARRTAKVAASDAWKPPKRQLRQSESGHSIETREWTPIISPVAPNPNPFGRGGPVSVGDDAFTHT